MKNRSKMDVRLKDRVTDYVKEFSFLSGKDEEEDMVKAVCRALEWGKKQDAIRKRELVKNSRSEEKEDCFENFDELKSMISRLYPEAYRRCIGSSNN